MAKKLYHNYRTAPKDKDSQPSKQLATDVVDATHERLGFENIERARSRVEQQTRKYADEDMTGWTQEQVLQYYLDNWEKINAAAKRQMQYSRGKQ